MGFKKAFRTENVCVGSSKAMLSSKAIIKLAKIIRVNFLRLRNLIISLHLKKKLQHPVECFMKEKSTKFQ